MFARLREYRSTEVEERGRLAWALNNDGEPAISVWMDKDRGVRRLGQWELKGLWVWHPTKKIN